MAFELAPPLPVVGMAIMLGPLLPLALGVAVVPLSSNDIVIVTRARSVVVGVVEGRVLAAGTRAAVMVPPLVWLPRGLVESEVAAVEAAPSGEEEVVTLVTSARVKPPSLMDGALV